MSDGDEQSNEQPKTRMNKVTALVTCTPPHSFCLHSSQRQNPCTSPQCLRNHCQPYHRSNWPQGMFGLYECHNYWCNGVFRRFSGKLFSTVDPANSIPNHYHFASTWDDNQGLAKAGYGTKSSTYPSYQDFTSLLTQFHQGKASLLWLCFGDWRLPRRYKEIRYAKHISPNCMGPSIYEQHARFYISWPPRQQCHFRPGCHVSIQCWTQWITTIVGSILLEGRKFAIWSTRLYSIPHNIFLQISPLAIYQKTTWSAPLPRRQWPSNHL